VTVTNFCAPDLLPLGLDSGEWIPPFLSPRAVFAKGLAVRPTIQMRDLFIAEFTLERSEGLKMTGEEQRRDLFIAEFILKRLSSSGAKESEGLNMTKWRQWQVSSGELRATTN
jgi:hypothetical protein